mmetsp:Transcript_10623/g.23417  ORF Transcript_10623/g.23417 Transcript_10623/m.23417 type:complete len:228 (+) Transcript_10623:199-882(+)
MMLASLMPTRVESMFLISPAGTQTYNKDTYNLYSYISLAENSRYETKKEADDAHELRKVNKHALSIVHDRIDFLKNILLNLICSATAKILRKGNYSEALISEFLTYYKAMLGRPGAGDITMQVPFMPPTALIHSMKETDRLNNSKVSFPVAMAFGNCDAFASSNGAEDILNLIKVHNQGQVNLFKIGGDSEKTSGSHCFAQELPEQTFELIHGHFERKLINVWQPTV